MVDCHHNNLHQTRTASAVVSLPPPLPAAVATASATAEHESEKHQLQQQQEEEEEFLYPRRCHSDYESTDDHANHHGEYNSTSSVGSTQPPPPQHTYNKMTTTTKHNHQNNNSSDEGSARKIRLRILLGALMLMLFSGVVYLGHLYVSALVALIQLLVFRELVRVRYNAFFDHTIQNRIPFFRTTQWCWFMLAIVYTYGDFCHDLIRSNPQLHHWLPLLSYVSPLSFVLYSSVFVWTISTLQSDSSVMKFQMNQLCWTSLVICVIVGQLKFVFHNIYHGLIWFVLPCSLVFINDMAAYMCGRLWGRRYILRNRPFLAACISPNKTWEGFVGALCITLCASLWLAQVLRQSPWLVCPSQVFTLRVHDTQALYDSYDDEYHHNASSSSLFSSFDAAVSSSSSSSSLAFSCRHSPHSPPLFRPYRYRLPLPLPSSLLLSSLSTFSTFVVSSLLLLNHTMRSANSSSSSSVSSSSPESSSASSKSSASASSSSPTSIVSSLSWGRFSSSVVEPVYARIRRLLWSSSSMMNHSASSSLSLSASSLPSSTTSSSSSSSSSSTTSSSSKPSILSNSVLADTTDSSTTSSSNHRLHNDDDSFDDDDDYYYYYYYYYYSITYYPIQGVALGLALFASLVAPYGGFFASAMKRAYGRKDFDSLIPGHGGVMDRVDCQFLMALCTSYVVQYYYEYDDHHHHMIHPHPNNNKVSVLDVTRLYHQLTHEERHEFLRNII